MSKTKEHYHDEIEKGMRSTIHDFFTSMGISENTYMKILICDSLYHNHRLVDLMEGYVKFINTDK